MDAVRFKTLLIQSGLKNFEVARKLGWRPAKLSSIVNGHWQVGRRDAEMICTLFNVPFVELFPELKEIRSKTNRVQKVRNLQ